MLFASPSGKQVDLFPPHYRNLAQGFEYLSGWFRRIEPSRTWVTPPRIRGADICEQRQCICYVASTRLSHTGIVDAV